MPPATREPNSCAVRACGRLIDANYSPFEPVNVLLAAVVGGKQGDSVVALAELQWDYLHFTYMHTYDMVNVHILMW